MASIPHVDKAFVKSNLETPSIRIVDVRSPEEYAEGHIPGAVLVSEASSLAFADPLPDAKTVEATFMEVGIDPRSQMILYCTVSVRAEAVAELLVVMGFPAPYVYEGSWLDWSSDPSSPIER